MRRLGIGVIAIVIIFSAGVSPASAQTDGDGSEGEVVATLDGVVGTRYVAAVAPIALTGVSSSLPADDYTVGVEELSRTGTNQWSVTARVCGASATDALVSDCTNRGDQLVNADGTNTIAGSALEVDERAVSELIEGDSGTLTAPEGAEVFSQPRTLFTNADQLNTQVYTETYTATGALTLTPPDGTVLDTYNGFYVVTLVQ